MARELNCLKIETRSTVYSVAFSPDGKMAAAGMDYSVSFWCSKTGPQGRRHQFQKIPALSVAFSHGMKVKAILAAGCSDGAIYLWDSSTGESYYEPIDKLTGHVGGVRSIAFTANGSKLLSGSNDGSVRLWDVSTKRQLMLFNGHGSCVFLLPPLKTRLQVEVQTTLFESGTCQQRPNCCK